MSETVETRGDDAGISLEAIRELVSRHTRLVILVTLGCTLASLGWLASKPPVYRAKATLILDSERKEGGVLGELAALTSAPKAASEIEILHSRTLAEETVASPGEGASRVQHLGLTTLVEDPRLKPLCAAWLRLCGDGGTDGGRLTAKLAPSGEPRATQIRVTFLAAHRVRLSAGNWTRHLNSSAVDDLEVGLTGGPVEFAGLRVELEPRGDLTGASFLLRRLEPAEAVERVLAATRVSETERSSGVIEVTYDDSDPRRAADTANALCANYLERNQRRGVKRASQTVDFIAGQLEAQNEALHKAEREVVALQQANPRAIDMSKTAESLIEELTGLEVERVQIRLSRVSIDQALDLLSEGRTEALSRLSVELADPISARYIEEIARLSAEAELQDRTDTGAYRALLQKQSLELEAKGDALALELASARSARQALAAGGAEAVARLRSGAEASQDPLLRGYLEELARAHSEHDALAKEFTPAHPDVARVEGVLRSLRDRIQALLDNRIEGLESQRAEFDRILAGYRGRTEGYPTDERSRIQAAVTSLRSRTATHLRSRLGGLSSRIDSIGGEVARIESELAKLPEDERLLADPQRRLQAHSEIVKLLLSRQQEAEITRAATMPGAEFIDPAVPPSKRWGPSIPLHLALGLALGFAFALALAFVRDSVHQRVFTAAELETLTGLPVFGTVPDFRHGRAKASSLATKRAGENFLPLRDEPEGPTAESYRSLRANLKFALSAEEGLKTLACTSCSPGEGKSVTNIDLALSFALNGKRVLLVDADMRKPSVHRYLGLELSPGLSNVLQGDARWRDAVRKNVHERLDVLTAGLQPPSLGELLDGDAFGGLLAELRAEYDLVVLDVPPALSVADIDSIAARLDALILVCKSNKVSGPVVAAAAGRLRQVGANLIGTVLNAVGSSGGSAYGYGYGYGYGQGSGAARRRRLAG
jgi:capsular exopolysaccharide synthesis family protein